MSQPIEITHHRDHKFQKKPRGRGCAECGRAKTAIEHYGAPPSLNIFGSGGNHFTYQNLKHAWQERLTELITEAGLEPCDRVVVEGEVCFPDRHRRDQGNHRFIVEKALGDALHEGGWLMDDDWTRYEFGGLSCRYVKGESWTRLMLFPSDANLIIVGQAA